MYLCYIDESGTPDVPGTTSHFVLAGLALPIWHWKQADRDISQIMAQYGLADQELHTAWLLRPYLEQTKVQNFEQLNHAARRSAVERMRVTHMLALQKQQNRKAYSQAKKNYKHTAAYIHLTYDERVSLVDKIADAIGNWGFARLFAECIDKTHFDPIRTGRTLEVQAIEQVISRFELYLKNTSNTAQRTYGLLVHDNNETIARKHTLLMRQFHREGTLWTRINHIIETPMFVDSSLTSMVQVADLCAYALRRFVENQEGNLFARIFSRADRASGGATVGVRHFAGLSCRCLICQSHILRSDGAASQPNNGLL